MTIPCPDVSTPSIYAENGGKPIMIMMNHADLAVGEEE